VIVRDWIETKIGKAMGLEFSSKAALEQVRQRGIVSSNVSVEKILKELEEQNSNNYIC
jgi:hypothetical protein